MNGDIDILGSIAGAVLLAVTGVAGWCVRGLVRLQNEHIHLKATVGAQHSETLRRLDTLHEWMRTVTTKLDSVLTNQKGESK